MPLGRRKTQFRSVTGKCRFALLLLQNPVLQSQGGTSQFAVDVDISKAELGVFWDGNSEGAEYPDERAMGKLPLNG